jgi:hypothetical protein
MVLPDKSASRDIEVFERSFAESPNLPLPPPGSLDTPAWRRRYHSAQLAIITGLFACAGLICSWLLVDSDEEFPRPHHWLQKSYASPVMTVPPAPAGTRVIPQNLPLRPNREDKTAESQRRRTAIPKLASSSSRSDQPAFGFRPVIDLRTKWTNFSENLRDRGMSFNSVRDRAFDFGRRLRQYRFEAPKLSVREDTNKNTDDAG